jgi:hypothetical protein
MHRHAIVTVHGTFHGIAAAGSLVQASTSSCRSGSGTHSSRVEDQRALAAPTRISPAAATE